MHHDVTANDQPIRIGNRIHRRYATCTCGWWAPSSNGDEHRHDTVRRYPF